MQAQHRGWQFDSSMCHNINAIGEEGNGRPLHEFHFPRKYSESHYATLEIGHVTQFNVIQCHLMSSLEI